MKPEIVMVGPMMPHVMAALDEDFTVHRLWKAEDRSALLDRARALRDDPPPDGWDGSYTSTTK